MFLFFACLSPDRRLPRSRDAVDLYLPCMSIDLAVRCTPRVDVLLDTSGRGLSAPVHVAIQGTAVLVAVSDWSGDSACFLTGLFLQFWFGPIRSWLAVTPATPSWERGGA